MHTALDEQNTLTIHTKQRMTLKQLLLPWPIYKCFLSPTSLTFHIHLMHTGVCKQPSLMCPTNVQ